MPIEVSCANCSGHFRVPDTAAGKKIRCPKCRGAIEVPAAEPTAARPTEVFVPPPTPPTLPAPAAPPQPAFVPPPLPKKQPTFVPPPAVSEPAPIPPAPPADEWHFKTATGEEYGPVGRDELDEWFREGRITADCKVLRAADDEWRWASEIYPQLQPPEDQESGVMGQESAVRDEPAAPPPPEPESSSISLSKMPHKAAAKAKKSTPVADNEADCSQRSRLVAGFLGVFLGPLGIHRFYLGYWGMGLAMMVTAGGLGLWSLIDAIFVMTGRVPDADGRPLSP